MKSSYKLVKQYFLLLISITILFASCQNARLNNFNRQKFTKLQPISIDQEVVDEVTIQKCDAQYHERESQQNLQKETSEKSIFDVLNDVGKDSYAIQEFSSLINPDSLFCDTIITATQTIFCIVKKVDSKEITFDSCPGSGKTYVINKTDVKYYSEPMISSEQKNEVIHDTLKPEIAEHKALSKRYFMNSLLCLLFLALGVAAILPLVMFGNTAILILLLLVGIAITSVAFIIGYTFLAMAVFHSRIYKMLEPEKFAKDSDAKTIHILTILGMLLFGCFPILIPFAIVWAIVKSKSNKVIDGQ